MPGGLLEGVGKDDFLAERLWIQRFGLILSHYGHGGGPNRGNHHDLRR